MTTITLGANTYNLVPLPRYPGFNEISFTMVDPTAVVASPYVPSQVQTQAWPGADAWGAQLSLPKMTERDAGWWVGFLAGLRGMQNVFQLGDPVRKDPYGSPAGTPIVSGANAVSATQLNTRGWPVSRYGLLLPKDYIQIGYRLHMVTTQVNSDTNGDAAISIWPSLRDPLADGATFSFTNCQGVFRLASNQRKWHTTVDQLSQISFPCVEVR